MNFISVCKNVIASNNKRGWVDPDPAIRVSNTKSGKVTMRSDHIGICDRDGNIVAEMVSTKDGKPVISCGAKVGLITSYKVVDMEERTIKLPLKTGKISREEARDAVRAVMRMRGQIIDKSDPTHNHTFVAEKGFEQDV